MHAGRYHCAQLYVPPFLMLHRIDSLLDSRHTRSLSFSVNILLIVWQTHYNVTDLASEADLHTFMANPEIFDVKDGHVTALQGMLFVSFILLQTRIDTTSTGPGLGIEMNEELIREVSARYVEKWRNPVWGGVDGSLREW